ncbi:MAG: hypothetical protein K6B14_08530 [Lachnospiraceae bacterium]|nr:hypothetical protein [Lachnospiraceae bacterium]
MEDIFKKADFTAGSDHKERLAKQLFSGDIVQIEEYLSDDELDLASAGVITVGYDPETFKK